MINNLIYVFLVGHFLSLDKYIAEHIHLFGLTFSTVFIQINGAALVATLFTMVWNYNGYKKFVFKAEAHE